MYAKVNIMLVLTQKVTQNVAKKVLYLYKGWGAGSREIQGSGYDVDLNNLRWLKQI